MNWPYGIVGERGPELFVPGAAGRIETNGMLRKLTADGAAAVASSSENTSIRGATTITNNWSINGADDPRAVARQIDTRFGELIQQLETERCAYLSD
ncbi:hypothetical protein [Rhodopseudomonas sp.]|uniref:hypothetical protein n=1 Tax=Rhodopseudomonas sp. TaxID=1078 RepID=UPI003B3AE80B